LKQIIIAIDGHSSCGKSTLAKQLAGILNYIYIDTGAMYRAVTQYFIENNIDIDNQTEIQNALSNIKIEFVIKNGQNHTILNGRDVESEIRSMAVNELVSEVSALSVVRSFLVQQQQYMGINKAIVMDGRDIGTVVFPEAELKIFLTASPDIRARRRQLEYQSKGIELSLDEIKQNLEHRDYIDSTREDSPLKKADDAVLLDNSNLSRKEQLEQVLSLVNQKFKESE
jgi:cytidylate kinase